MGVNTGWSAAEWRSLDRDVRSKLRDTTSGKAAWRHCVRGSRQVLRAFSSSFFVVTRFLPPRKRAAVEVVYAAVRYPDEIVDTFPISACEREAELERWRAHYRSAIGNPCMVQAVRSGTPWILAAFARLVREYSMPPRWYEDFLDAMKRDVRPAPFATLDDLIESYVYGSAVVVGYFLSQIYGPGPGYCLGDACRVGRELGIALQLTNFSRDVGEDHHRGRLYVPMDLLQTRGLAPATYMDPGRAHDLHEAVCDLASEAERRYRIAAGSLEVFAPDSRIAIRACIDVYRRLNTRILAGGGSGIVRHTVPLAEKFGVLPPSKYWRLPLAWMGAL